MKKRIMSIILVLAIVCALLPQFELFANASKGKFLLSSMPELKTGDKVVIYHPTSGMAVSNADHNEYSSHRAGVAVSPIGGMIADPVDSIVWTITLVDGGFTLSDSNGALLSLGPRDPDSSYTNNLFLDGSYTVWQIRKSGIDGTVNIVNVSAPVGMAGDPRAVEWYDYFSEFTTFYLSDNTQNSFAMQIFVSTSAEYDSPFSTQTKRLSELSSLDYLAFANISYKAPPAGGKGTTIEDMLQLSAHGDEYCFEKGTVTYSDLYDDIKGWRYYSSKTWEDSGFYAVTFENNYGEAIISFRGSEDLFSPERTEVYKDWVCNDLKMFIGNKDADQVSQALEYYNSVHDSFSTEAIAITGHSLGGGLGDIVSALTGSYAETWNAAPFLDIAYTYYPELSIRSYSGTDRWNFVDHYNPWDTFVGNWNNDRKPRYKHDYYAPGSTATNHTLYTFLKKANGHVQLTDSTYLPASPGKWPTVFGKYFCIYMGTSGYDKYDSFGQSVIVYGGTGSDKLQGSQYADSLIGGPGNDKLNGEWGDDTYYYYKGDGFDTIHDSGGHNEIYLLGFDESEISFATDGKSITVLHGTEGLTAEGLMEFTGSDFTVYYGDTSKSFEQVGGKFHKHYEIACPVDVLVVDKEGNTVYNVDGSHAETYYTDYGYFYVHELENGEFCKEIDLREGYEIRVVGTADGYMDIRYQPVTENTLGDPIGLESVSVTEGMQGIFVEDDAEGILLVIDSNGDGQADKTLELQELEPKNQRSGEICDGITWELDENYCLTISGIGSLADYEAASFPWRDYTDLITEVVIQEGISALHPNMFQGLQAVKSISFATSVTDISAIILSDCVSLEKLEILNPVCIMPAGMNSLGHPTTTLIYGYRDSTAESYAELYGYTFVVLNNQHEHDWNEPTYEWALDFGTVTATRICKNDVGHVETETVNTTSEVTTPATCTAKGKTTYTATFTNSAFATQTKTVENVPALGHTPVAAVKENEIAATCTTAGGYDMVVYCSVCSAELSREHSTIDAIGHNYELTGWTWTGFTAASATFTCKNDASHVEKVDATITSVRTEPTANQNGSVVYTAKVTFEESEYTDTKTDILPALGHDYELSGWNWTDYTAAAATFTDKNGGDLITVNATITSERTEPTCTEEGKVVYTATVTFEGKDYTDAKTETLDALDHDWNKPEYIWAEDYSTVTATRTCKNDASHVEAEKVNTISEVTKPATYDEEGEIVYTATFENEAFATQTKAVATPKLEKPDDPTPGLPCDGGESCPGNIFTDMPAKGNWAHDAIDWAIVTGITSGTSATTFSPNQGCTRSQVVTFLWRAAGSPEPETTNNPFKDVAAGVWYYKAVLWASETGVTAGTSTTTFSPNQTCTRGQIVTFIWRYEGSPEATSSNNPFTDVPDGTWYTKAVLWASKTGVTAGTSATTFSPNATCTRAQIVTFLYRYSQGLTE